MAAAVNRKYGNDDGIRQLLAGLARGAVPALSFALSMPRSMSPATE